MSREQSGPGAGRQLRLLLAIGGLAVLMVLVFAIRGVLVPFILAFVMAYILAPLVDRLEARGVSRTLSIICIFAGAFGVLGTAAFTAGGRVSDEILELSDRFLRREHSDRELTLTNIGSEPMTIALAVKSDSGATAFSLLNVISGAAVVGAGETSVVRLRFSPEDAAEGRGGLVLSTMGQPGQIRVALRGNSAHPASPYFDDDELRLGSLIVGSRHLDFGSAGPNPITSLSESVSQIQPLLEPYVGGDFNLAEFVAVRGRDLIDERLLGGTTELLGGVFSGLSFVVIVPFIAFFFLKEGSAITRGIIELVPNAYFELCLNLLHQISGQIGGYIRGQLVATTVVAMLAVGGLHIIGVGYALPLGLLAGVANMIPFLGPLIGIISASTVALASGDGMAMVGPVIVLYLVIQLVDNILVQPTVVARSVEMHPLMVLFAVMVGSQLMGIAGMLIAVPLFGIAKVCAQTVYSGVKGYRV
jgi:predicted PurR-regulated permease PerM